MDESERTSVGHGFFFLLVDPPSAGPSRLSRAANLARRIFSSSIRASSNLPDPLAPDSPVAIVGEEEEAISALLLRRALFCFLREAAGRSGSSESGPGVSDSWEETAAAAASSGWSRGGVAPRAAAEEMVAWRASAA